MFRRSLLINCVFSFVSTVAMMAMMPAEGSVTAAAKASFLTFAQESAVLAPLVHRTLLLR